MNYNDFDELSNYEQSGERYLTYEDIENARN